MPTLCTLLFALLCVDSGLGCAYTPLPPHIPDPTGTAGVPWTWPSIYLWPSPPPSPADWAETRPIGPASSRISDDRECDRIVCPQQPPGNQPPGCLMCPNDISMRFTNACMMKNFLCKHRKVVQGFRQCREVPCDTLESNGVKPGCERNCAAMPTRPLCAMCQGGSRMAFNSICEMEQANCEKMLGCNVLHEGYCDGPPSPGDSGLIPGPNPGWPQPDLRPDMDLPNPALPYPGSRFGQRPSQPNTFPWGPNPSPNPGQRLPGPGPAMPYSYPSIFVTPEAHQPPPNSNTIPPLPKQYPGQLLADVESMGGLYFPQNLGLGASRHSPDSHPVSKRFIPPGQLSAGPPPGSAGPYSPRSLIGSGDDYQIPNPYPSQFLSAPDQDVPYSYRSAGMWARQQLSDPLSARQGLDLDMPYSNRKGAHIPPSLWPSQQLPGQSARQELGPDMPYSYRTDGLGARQQLSRPLSARQELDLGMPYSYRSDGLRARQQLSGPQRGPLSARQELDPDMPYSYRNDGLRARQQLSGPQPGPLSARRDGLGARQQLSESQPPLSARQEIAKN